MSILLAFWLDIPYESIGNEFLHNYPHGFFLELQTNRQLTLTLADSNLLVQFGTFFNEGTLNRRAFKGLYGGFYNAFLSFGYITLGQRAYRMSKIVLWDNVPLKSFSLKYKGFMFIFAYVDRVELSEETSLGGKTYPVGSPVFRYLNVRRLEYKGFFLAEYGLIIVPYDVHLPVSALLPIGSTYEIQWNEGFETNTVLSLGYYDQNLYVELSIDDFQYSPESFRNIPPDFGIYLRFRKSSLILELLYASPYMFSNTREVSKWLFQGTIPSLLESDALKFMVTYSFRKFHFTLGVYAKGSYDISMKDPYPNYKLQFPLTSPYRVYPYVRCMLNAHFRKFPYLLSFELDRGSINLKFNFLMGLNFSNR